MGDNCRDAADTGSEPTSSAPGERLSRDFPVQRLATRRSQIASGFRRLGAAGAASLTFSTSIAPNASHRHDGVSESQHALIPLSELPDYMRKHAARMRNGECVPSWTGEDPTRPGSEAVGAQPRESRQAYEAIHSLPRPAGATQRGGGRSGRIVGEELSKSEGLIGRWQRCYRWVERAAAEAAPAASTRTPQRHARPYHACSRCLRG